MRFLASIAFFLLLTVPAVAAKTTYICSMNDRGGGWVGRQVVLSLDPSTGTAFVLDEIVYSVHEKAIPGDFSVKAKQNVVTWRVLVKDRHGSIAHLAYRAALLNQNTRAVISATPGGRYEGRFSARGTCAPTKQEFPGM